MILEIRGEERFPQLIDGDATKDDIFELYPDIKIYPEIQKLIKESGDEWFANQILWAHVIVYDPRRFLSNKTTHAERMKVVEEGYFDVEWELYGYVREFVINVMLFSDDAKTYVRMKKAFEDNLTRLQGKDGNLGLDKKMKDRDELKKLERQVMMTANDMEIKRVAGRKQPGGKKFFKNK